MAAVVVKPLDDTDASPAIQPSVIGELPTLWTIAGAGSRFADRQNLMRMPAINAKRVYRIMRQKSRCC